MRDRRRCLRRLLRRLRLRLLRLCSAGGAGSCSDAAADVRSFTRVAEITRKLYRQGTAAAVLSTAVKEIGSHWEATRCMAAMVKPGLPPTAMDEFCAEGLQEARARGDWESWWRACNSAVDGHEPLAIQDAPQVRCAAGGEESSRQNWKHRRCWRSAQRWGRDGWHSRAAAQARPRLWQQADMVVLKTVADQMVIALNNAGLRRLVKNLSVTDEKSGLLKRASYLDLLHGGEQARSPEFVVAVGRPDAVR